jgi:hypothetical protein
MTAKATIFVRVQVPGWHYWPGAGGRRAYLGQPHRHLFHIEASMLVEHDEREVEFHDLMATIRQRLDWMGSLEPDMRGQHEGINFGGRSCETIARELGAYLATTLRRDVMVAVSEDGECGAQLLSPWPAVVGADEGSAGAERALVQGGKQD